MAIKQRASFEVKKNGESLMIEKNDDVFVAHKWTPRGKEVENGDGHWKATVSKIYVKRGPARKKETAWVLVYWYCSRQDIAELELPRRDSDPPSEYFPRYLGTTELFKSDHLSVIGISTIDSEPSKTHTRTSLFIRAIDDLEVHQFDDADLSGDLIECRSWYMHYTIHINPDSSNQGHITSVVNKCGCEVPYQPNARQRYCANCRKWFHEHCTKRFTPAVLDSPSAFPAPSLPAPSTLAPSTLAPSTLPPSPLLKRILAIPTARVFISAWARRSETVGTGKTLEELHEWRGKHPHASDDEIQAQLKEIDEEFFKDALEHEWEAFVCAECGSQI
ncbi:hypothetical protein D9756_010730 [Leucocoprinus leucothites]|uniref:BAH domain-containing protein n=1 Tax=Leucocoprinus leucothites TaxID=201217 RepID=A0A8H5CUC0_9AGAR|nr:hypothetical protein D9756_010730 [Leucoagaricus leucothites]